MRGSIRLPASGRVSDPLGPSPASVTYALTWERNRGTLPEPFWHLPLSDVLYDAAANIADVTPRRINFRFVTASYPTVYAGSPPNGAGTAIQWPGTNENSNTNSSAAPFRVGGWSCSGCQYLINGQLAEASFFSGYALTVQDEEDLAGVLAPGGAQVNRLFVP